MIKQTLLEHLVAYRSGSISREALEKSLDELYVSAAEQSQKTLNIHAIFVSLALSRLQAAPGERYCDQETDLLIDALSGRGFACYQAFHRISADMLTPSEASILAIAKDFLSHADQGAAGKWLNEENDPVWQSILRCDRGKRAEFAEPETVPAWIVGQIKYLLWIAMSDKKTTLLGLERDELRQKIAHHCRLLSGESAAFVTVGQNFCTIV